MAERLRFDFDLGRPARRASFTRGDDEVMRILLLADFSGRGLPYATPPAKPLSERAPRRVDVDEFEDVLRRWTPRLTLPAGDGTDARIALELSELDAFHPDSLYQRVPTFQRLRELRRRLVDPASAADALAELKRGSDAPAPAAATLPAAEEGDAALLERLLGGTAAPTSAQTAARSAVDELIRRAVQPHVVPARDPQVTQLIAAVDEAIGEEMRRILHDPGFQAMESAWRGVHSLVTGLETSEALQLHLLDVSKSELAADITAAEGDLERSALYRVLMRHGPGMPDGPGWSVLAGHYRFGTGAEDVQLLAALGAIGAQVGGPFLAEADAAILGCRSLVETPDERRWSRLDDAAAERWRALRRSGAAHWLGLVLPRILVRAPYGRDGEPVDAFPFEEMAAVPAHDSYLWGSPAFACALLLGQAYVDAGAAMTPGDRQELADLPCHGWVDGGARVLTPCGEVLLSERTADAILAHGLMPTLSFANRNAVRIARFQSLADPAAPLAGPWAR